MLTMQTINAVLFAPVFYFLSIITYVLTLGCLFSFLKTDSSFGVLACILFVAAYNMWYFANKLRNHP